MEDGVNYLATEDYEDLIDYEPEDCEKTWRTGQLPAADELTTVDEVEGRRSAADQQIEDSRDDARLEAISRREKELAAELEEIDARLYEIRNLQSGTKVKQRPNKEMTAAETLLREEDRRKEREYFLKEAAGRNSTRRREENQRQGGRVHQGRGGQRKHYWVKEDGLPKKGYSLQNSRHRDTRMGLWMEEWPQKSFPTPRHPIALVKGVDRRGWDSARNQAFL